EIFQLRLLRGSQRITRYRLTEKRRRREGRLRKNDSVVFCAGMSVERQGVYVFLIVSWKTELDALADLVAGNTGSRGRLCGQKSHRLILVTRTNDIKVTIFGEIEIKPELLPGCDRH